MNSTADSVAAEPGATAGVEAGAEAAASAAAESRVEPSRAVRIIAGPTGAGKSALALAIAERHGAMLVSADSRQVYRGFDIGTAKPSAAERARVRHEGLDVAGPEERWSAVRWADAATGWLADAAVRGQKALVVGGTGFWLSALVHPLADEPVLDPERRRALHELLAARTTADLRREVERLDPPRATLGRAQLLRAAEVALLSGTRLSDWHAAGASRPRRAARWLIVDPGPVIHQRLEARLGEMFDAGWEDEVRGLIASVPSDAPAWNACGYREIRDLVEGRRTRHEAERAILISTRQYAKRQRTWFRNQLTDERQVLRLDPGDPDALARADRWFLEGDDT